MSRNGSGVYSLPAGNPVVTGTTISSSWANTTLSDIATALTGSVAADGQTAMTGNLQMGNNKITGLAVATSSGDALSYGQAATVSSLTVSGAFAANGGATLGDASGDALTINSSAVSIPNGLNFDSNTLVIDATNDRVGVGTASPAVKLQVAGSIALTSANNLSWGGAYGAGIPTLTADGTNGFQFYPAGSTSGETMRINASGNVGIGTSSPASQLDITKTGDAVISLTSSGVQRYQLITRSGGRFDFYDQSAGANRWSVDQSGNLLVGTTNATSNSGVGIKFVQSPTDPFVAVVASTNASGSTAYNLYSTATSSYRFYVSTSGTISAVNTTISSLSDQRYKENIVDLDVGLNKIMALKPRKFDWKEGKGKNTKGDRGFIAQEFEQVFPDLVDEWKDPAPEGEEPYKSVRADLIPVLVKAIQELNAKVDSLQTELNTLKGQ